MPVAHFACSSKKVVHIVTFYRTDVFNTGPSLGFLLLRVDFRAFLKPLLMHKVYLKQLLVGN